MLIFSWNLNLPQRKKNVEHVKCTKLYDVLSDMSFETLLSFNKNYGLKTKILPVRSFCSCVLCQNSMASQPTVFIENRSCKKNFSNFFLFFQVLYIKNVRLKFLISACCCHNKSIISSRMNECTKGKAHRLQSQHTPVVFYKIQ